MRGVQAPVGRWVEAHLAYVPGSSAPTDGAVDTLLSGSGVCRDCGRLTVSLLRAMNGPARLVAVYAPGLRPMDFHAVAEALQDGAWHVIDSTSPAPLDAADLDGPRRRRHRVPVRPPRPNQPAVVGGHRHGRRRPADRGLVGDRRAPLTGERRPPSMEGRSRVRRQRHHLGGQVLRARVCTHRWDLTRWARHGWQPRHGTASWTSAVPDVLSTTVELG